MKDFSRLLKKGPRHGRLVHTGEKSKEPRSVFVVSVVRAIHNRRNAPHRATITLGHKRRYRSVAPVESGLG